MPDSYLDPLGGASDDAALMSALAARQLLFRCPSAVDDFLAFLRRFVLQDAAADACIVTNDPDGSRSASVRCVPFLFIGDEFLPVD